MSDVIVGGVYRSNYSWGSAGEVSFIVTAVGLNHILITNYPLIKFNESYLEYCVGRKEFKDRFKFAREQK
ncbi:TPA: hypothetical protein GNA69_004604 [Salmonella enterica subsp. enterica serovar Enteritidis]|nr:hypothetical protein [Salmonella enterica subsp. enterica serovar Enteritidis]